MKYHYLRILAVVVVCATFMGCSASPTAGTGSETRSNRELGELLLDTDYHPQESQEFQTAVALCMTERGFKYFPHTRSSSNPDRDGGREWVEKFGLGITTQTFPETHLPKGLAGYEVGSDFVDPNSSYVDSLGYAEQEEYYSALFGARQLPVTTRSDSNDVEPVDKGCLAEAEKVDPVISFIVENEIKYLETFSRLESGAERVSLEQELVTCVRSQGYQFTSIRESIMAFDKELEAVREYANPDGSVQADGLEILGQLQAEEQRLGLSIFDCKAEMDYDVRVLSLREQLFREAFSTVYKENSN